MKNTFFAKIFVSYAILISVLSGLIIFFSFNSIKKHNIETEEQRLEGSIVMLSVAAEKDIYSGNGAVLETAVKKMTEGTDLRFTIIKPDGTVFADSGSDPSRMDNHLNRPEVRKALEGSEGMSIRYSNTIKENMLYLARPFPDKHGKTAAILRASMPLKDIKKISSSINADIAKASVMVLVIALVATFVFTRRFYAPVSALANAARKVAGGNFDAKVTIKEGADLKELADHFNEMTGRIKNLFKEVSLKKGQLEAVLSSIAEGLIVVDEKGKIVLMNDSFRKISGTDCKEGSFYWECFMPPKFNKSIEDGLKESRNFIEQIEVRDRVYLCGGTFLGLHKQAAVILYDITEFKDLERIKKDFVANVSHELRTPLTAIKGFAETLEETTKNPEARHYLEIIKKHTERLINIVNDLLTLSRLEHLEKIPGSQVDLNEVVGNAAKIFEQTIRQKGLEFSVIIGKDVPKFTGDPLSLEQVFVNLIDNAIKYTEKGSVSIAAGFENQAVRVTVTDSGSGISPEHLPRIFERFYTVDKSRSKKFGGTGLGLAIVKHILLLHGGTINADSQPGIGTRFTLNIPLK